MALCRRLKMRIILQRDTDAGYETSQPVRLRISNSHTAVGALLWLLPAQAQEEVVDEGRELVADQDPVLVDQVVGGDVGVGPAESLLQRVPLEGGDHMVLC